MIFSGKLWQNFKTLRNHLKTPKSKNLMKTPSPPGQRHLGASQTSQQLKAVGEATEWLTRCK